MLHCNGDLRTMRTDGHRTRNVQGTIASHVDSGSNIKTDEHPGFNGLPTFSNRRRLTYKAFIT